MFRNMQLMQTTAAVKTLQASVKFPESHDSCTRLLGSMYQLSHLSAHLQLRYKLFDEACHVGCANTTPGWPQRQLEVFDAKHGQPRGCSEARPMQQRCACQMQYTRVPLCGCCRQPSRCLEVECTALATYWQVGEEKLVK